MPESTRRVLRTSLSAQRSPHRILRVALSAPRFPHRVLRVALSAAGTCVAAARPSDRSRTDVPPPRGQASPTSSGSHTAMSNRAMPYVRFFTFWVVRRNPSGQATSGEDE